MKKLSSVLLVFSMLFSGCAIQHEKEKKIYEDVLIQETPSLKTEEGTLDSVQKKREKILEKDIWNLEDCYTIALVENRDLRIVGENYFQSYLLQANAFGIVLPKVDLNGNYQLREKIPPLFPGGDEFTVSEERASSITIDQPLFQGFKEIAAFGYAKAMRESARYQLLWMRTQIYLQTSKNFYRILAAKRSIHVLKTTLNLQKERLDEIEGRYEVGLARRTEVLMIRSTLEKTASLYVQAKLEYQLALKEMSVFLWTSGVKPLKDDLVIPDDQKLKKWMEDAISNRLDLKSAEADVNAAQKNVKMVEADFWPVVSLNVNYFLFREGVFKDISWEALSILTAPIFNRGITKTKHRQAASQWRQAVSRYENLRNKIEAEVTAAHHHFLSVKSKIEFLKEEVASAKENYMLLQGEYRQGLTTNLEVMTVLDQYRNSLLQLQIEEFNLKIAYIGLRTAVGTIF